MKKEHKGGKSTNFWCEVPFCKHIDISLLSQIFSNPNVYVLGTASHPFYLPPFPTTTMYNITKKINLKNIGLWIDER